MPAEPVVHVIDDDEAVRESLAFLLETADYNVHAYDSATGFLAGLDKADSAASSRTFACPG